MDALNQLQSLVILEYEQHNITNDVAPHLLELTYTDNLSGQSDSLDVVLADPEGKWADTWYPGHGDTLSVSFGWKGGQLRAGRFEIDEIELAYAPSQVRVRALATGTNRAVRTVEHREYEKTTLAAVAQQVAQRQGLTLTGRIEPIPLDRLTQRQSDLAFLAQLAEEYDYAFKVVGSRLVFHSISDLAAASVVETLDPEQVSNLQLRDQIRTVPAKVANARQDPATGSLVSYQIVNGETVAVPSSQSKTTTASDTRKQRRRSAGADADKARAAADLARANRERTTGSWSRKGHPNLFSGQVVELVQAGKLSGKYLLTGARHAYTRGAGFRSDFQASRVAAQSIGLALDKSQPALALASYGIDGSVA